MTLLYAKEHKACYNYENSNSPIVEKQTFVEGDKWVFSTIKNKIIYIAQGECFLLYNQYKDKRIQEGQLILIPAGHTVSGYAKCTTTAYTMRLKETKNLCECFSLDMLLKEEEEGAVNDNLHLLNSSPKIKAFFDLWEIYIEDGLMCKYFLNLKIKELFYLLRTYHTKSELLDFFYPLLSNDMTFSDFVLRKHFTVKTVNELAESANYSLSGFQKRFKKVFGTSPSIWMKEEKLKAIFHAINSTSNTFKEISSQYGFSSPSHFNDFCKTNFGYTPGILRKSKINLRITKE